MLFKTAAEFKTYVPVNVNFDLDQLTPFIKTVERDFLKKDICLGSAEYTALEAAYQANSMSAAQTALLPYAQEVVACFAFVKWIPTGQLDISDVGIRINSNSEQKQAFQWQINELTREWIANGYSAQEALLTFLQSNRTTYTTWAGSNAFTVYKEFLFTGADDFQTFFNIQSSRRTYASLATVIRLVESLYIVPTIGCAYLNELKTKFHAQPQTLTSDDNNIITDLKNAIAHLTIHHACKTLPVEVAGDGIVINSFLSNNDESVQREPAPMPVLKRLEYETEVLGRSLLEKVRLWLNKYASATVFATYFASGLYDDPAADNPNEWSNEDKGIFVL